MLSTYSHLSALVPGAPTSLALATPAAIEAIQLVDQQIAALNFVQIQGGFQGAQQMAQAVAGMKTAAAPWPGVKAAIFAAARETLAAGPAAAALGNADSTAAQLAADVNAFATGTLTKIVSDFASAQAGFNTFSAGMDQAYSQSANANQAAANAIAQGQQQINYEIQMLNAKESNLRSAGSIIIGIFSAGISYAVEIRQLEQEADQLRSQEQQQSYQLALYQNSLGSFNNALNATKLAAYALSTLSTSLQQSANAVKDVSSTTNANLIVMQAELAQFKSEFAQAVATVSQLLA